MTHSILLLYHVKTQVLYLSPIFSKIFFLLYKTKSYLFYSLLIG